MEYTVTHHEPGEKIEYWTPSARQREVAYWAQSAQVQLDKWEALAAQDMRDEFYSDIEDDSKAWRVPMEEHFALIAAAQLICAMQFASCPVHIDETVRVEIPAGRDMREHWSDNMPFFNQKHRPGEPKRKSGQEFAKRNPKASPYWSARWDNGVGLKLLPNVPVGDVRRLIVAAKRWIEEVQPMLTRFFTEPEPSPWTGGDGPDRWWPTGAPEEA